MMLNHSDSNFAKAVHLRKHTQVWDAVVSHKESGKTIVLFRCTQITVLHDAQVVNNAGITGFDINAYV